jgi:diaminohydroxyphosphoribosylaminopyrimidine deaminase/5-amino-6-(5-phosphoribosylamino)uracil reductase
MDAIVVGIGTVLADDPQLTARPPGPRIPCRIVLDSGGRLPPDSTLVRSAREVPVVVATTQRAANHRASALLSQGCEVLILPDVGGRTNISALLDELGRRRMTNILVEGGAEVLGSFLDDRAIDEVHVFIAPTLLGGEKALPPIAGDGIDRIADALLVRDWNLEMVDDNVLIHGRVGSGDG